MEYCSQWRFDPPAAWVDHPGPASQRTIMEPGDLQPSDVFFLAQSKIIGKFSRF
jgi:hypothetical protein